MGALVHPVADQRAPARPLRGVMIGLAIAAFLLVAMWLVSLRSTSVAVAGVTLVVLGTSTLVLGAFGTRLNRASSFDSYRERQRAETSVGRPPWT